MPRIIKCTLQIEDTHVYAIRKQMVRVQTKWRPTYDESDRSHRLKILLELI